jgi:hypothetical protein
MAILQPRLPIGISLKKTRDNSFTCLKPTGLKAKMRNETRHALGTKTQNY